MTDWYRRTEWTDEMAADFEARLSRARPAGRAQYLSLQGYALLSGRPEQAERLLERAVATDEKAELPRAACYLAMSRVAQRKIDSAIAAYQLAIEAERRNPAHRSTSGVDQAFLIAMHDRRDLFGHALDQLAVAVADDWSLAGVEALAAEAIIRHVKGEIGKARELAAEALRRLPANALGAEWAGISLAGLRNRLEAIAR